jgi:anti-sigma regulatory factor (Ser/Thr protein kinase)
MSTRQVIAEVDTGWPAGVADPLAFGHAALLYSGMDEYRGEISALARQAVGAPFYVAAPGEHLAAAEEALRSSSASIFLTDVAELGRNPARIIPAVRSFAADYPGEHVCFLWEPVWPGRTAAELREVARQEALCNLAFDGVPMTVVCLYDTSLGGGVLSHAERTHPIVIEAGQRRDSGTYQGAGRFPPGCDDPLPRPARRAETMEFDGHLEPVRALVTRHARAAGLGSSRVADFVIAISELAANSYSYAGGRGVIRVWRTGDELLCQVEDAGHITDPLAGSRRQPPGSTSGYGLWLVNEVCDLVERRTGPAGTITRLHMSRKRTAR